MDVVVAVDVDIDIGIRIDIDIDAEIDVDIHIDRMIDAHARSTCVHVFLSVFTLEYSPSGPPPPLRG